MVCDLGPIEYLEEASSLASDPVLILSYMPKSNTAEKVAMSFSNISVCRLL